MGKRRTGGAERLSEFFGIPAEAAGVSRITLVGQSRVQIEGHGGLLELTEDRVAVRCGRQTVRISGSGLRLYGMNRRCIAFTGKIAALDLGG